MLKADEKRAQKLVGTSASDCQTSIMLSAERTPVEAIADVANALCWLNEQCLEKKAHRQALMKGGRAALKKLGEF